jgi:hypothetical protein
MAADGLKPNLVALGSKRFPNLLRRPARSTIGAVQDVMEPLAIVARESLFQNAYGAGESAVGTDDRCGVV